MITIPTYKVSEASAVYGDFGVEKVAFNINVNPADVLGAIAGGYASNHIYNKKKDQADQEQQQSQRIENDSYAQIQNLMQNLKIVFTPINVIFSVNGQVFDIIQASEMNAYMKQAFVQKDADYFRNLLMNKINMELQMAEQAFSQRLLSAGGYGDQAKEASYANKQEALAKIAEEQFGSMVKTASTGIEGFSLSINPSFDSLRPFDKSEIFFRPNEFKKVASIFDILGHDDGQSQDIGVHRFNHEVNVGFLPDRVVFLWNGQLVDQLSVLHMNEQGYEAFRNRDRDFFLNLFKKQTIETDKEMHASPSQQEEKAPESEEEAQDKTAATLEVEMEEDEDDEPLALPSHINIFQDPDVHPVVYDMVLNNRYGNWARYELEALMKQIEVDFKLESGIGENPFNKIAALHTVAGPDHAMFLAPFTFEKFMRTMNSKVIYFEDFQGNITLGELLFGLEIAKSYCGDEVFWEFHNNIAPYCSEELMRNGVRYVSKHFFDTSNPSEQEFFDELNGYLMRKWKEFDSQGITDAYEIEQHHILTEQIVEISDEVIERFEDIDMTDPYNSIGNIVEDFNYLSPVDPEYKEAVRNAVKQTVLAQLMAALLLDYKHRQLVATIDQLKEEGVYRGE